MPNPERDMEPPYGFVSHMHMGAAYTYGSFPTHMGNEAILEVPERMSVGHNLVCVELV
jgi:hypothetical protein